MNDAPSLTATGQWDALVEAAALAFRLHADTMLANPPFIISDWDGAALANDARWRCGTPPVGNAN